MDTSKLDGFFESIKVIFINFDTIQLYKELSNHLNVHFGQTILMTDFHKKLHAIFQALLLYTCMFPITLWTHTQAKVIKLYFVSFIVSPCIFQINKGSILQNRPLN